MSNHRLNEKGMVQPVSQFCHDYMHGILQGTGPVVLYQTFMEIERQGLAIWEAMETYLGYFTFPKQWSCSHLPSLMSKKRVEKYKQAQEFQSQASECLALYPCIRQFLQNVVLPAGTCPLACAAFLAQAGLMDQCHFGCMSKATSRTSLLQIAELAISSFHQQWGSSRSGIGFYICQIYCRGMAICPIASQLSASTKPSVLMPRSWSGPVHTSSIFSSRCCPES